MSNEKVMMKEREIRLADLCIDILLRWRVIIVSMLIGAVLFAGLNYVQSRQNVNAQQALVENAKLQLEELLDKENEIVLEIQENHGGSMDSVELIQKVLENQMTENQLNNVNNALAYEKLYNDKIDYQEQSVLMQMDPNAVPKAEITFYITSENMEKTYNIEKAYEDIVCGGELQEEIAKGINISKEVVGELLGLETSSYGMTEGLDTLRMYVRHYDETICAEIAQLVIGYIGEKHEDIQAVMGTHEIVVLEQTIITSADSGIMNHQKSYVTDIISLRNNIVGLKNNFGKLEWQYYDLELNGELTELSEQKIQEIKVKEADAASTNKSTNAIGSIADEKEALEEIIEKGVNVPSGISFKYIIVGMILGAFVYVFVISLMYILNNKMRFSDDLQQIYGITQLGQIPETRGKNKIFGFVDQWILFFRYRNKRRFTETEALELAAVAIKMGVNKMSVNTVYLIGCDLKERSLSICEEIKGLLQKENLNVQILSNVLYDAQKMQKLEAARCVVLVERADSTLYEEIAKELEILKRQDIEILGGITVE